jgi:hypothetical protein
MRLTPPNCQLVAQHDDFEFLELSGSEQKEDQLENA